MTEDFLHYLWKHQYFQIKDLATSIGDSVEVLHPGYHNHDSGPDFKEAQIRIGKKTWAGSVEIHVRSSDWFRHNHQSDQAYHNVILHVVYKHDKEVPDASGASLPVLILENRFDEYQYWRFEQLVQSDEPIPCYSQLRQVETVILNKMLERALCEKLEAKSRFILEQWELNDRDWLKTSYRLLAYGLGLKINAEAMLMLTRRVPWRLMMKESAELYSLEAMLLGTSGLLRGVDDYSNQLMDVYQHLQRKYDLEIMPKAMWKYSRLRPASFPERRIAQFARLIFYTGELPGIILNSRNLKEVRSYLGPFDESDYWSVHFRLGKPIRNHRKMTINLGLESIERMMINVMIPLRFAYDHNRGDATASQLSINWLEQISPENNKVVRLMNQAGFEMSTAAGTQGALHLNMAYCRPKKCLNCAIGNKILRQHD